MAGAPSWPRGVWRDQREQFAPRHDLLHFIEQDLLARAPAAEIKAKVFLFHAVVDGNLRASVKKLGAELQTLFLSKTKSKSIAENYLKRFSELDD